MAHSVAARRFAVVALFAAYYVALQWLATDRTKTMDASGGTPTAEALQIERGMGAMLGTAYRLALHPVACRDTICAHAALDLPAFRVELDGGVVVRHQASVRSNASAEDLLTVVELGAPKLEPLRYVVVRPGFAALPPPERIGALEELRRGLAAHRRRFELPAFPTLDMFVLPPAIGKHAGVFDDIKTSNAVQALCIVVAVKDPPSGRAAAWSRSGVYAPLVVQVSGDEVCRQTHPGAGCSQPVVLDVCPACASAEVVALPLL